MPVEVRAVRDEELVDWSGVMHIAFHSRRSAEVDAAYRREVWQQDLSRTLGAFEDGRVVGTYESFAAEMTLPGGGCVTTNAVSSVTVLPTHHRRGLLTRMITQDLRDARERGEVASILLPAEWPIYGRFGFGPAIDGAEYRLQCSAARFLGSPPAGSIELVSPSRMLEVAPRLFDRFRRSYPGQIDRRPTTWEARVGVRETPWRSREDAPLSAIYKGSSGEVEGYLLYRVERERRTDGDDVRRLDIQDLITLTPAAYLALWRYCAEMDLITEVSAGMRRFDEPLTYLLDNPRVAFRQTERYDFLWLRPLDVARFLSARRYLVADRLVFEVSDPLDLCAGRFALDDGSCSETSQSADLSLSMLALGALSLGGVGARALAEGGLIAEHTPGAIDRADRLFRWPVAPWCSTFF